MKKVIVITGASSGIGAALARQFARDEVILALVARRREALEAVAKSVEEAGGTAHVFPADMADRGAVSNVLTPYNRNWVPSIRSSPMLELVIPLLHLDMMRRSWTGLFRLTSSVCLIALRPSCLKWWLDKTAIL